MKLIIMRHGKTEANEKRLYCGKTDISLSEKGKSELLEKKSEFQFPDISGMKIITSGKKRCEETLSLIYGNVPHTSDTAFCEMDFGKFEMRSYEEMKNDPHITAERIGQKNGMSRPTVQRMIAKMKKSGFITHQGSNNGGVWVITADYVLRL